MRRSWRWSRRRRTQRWRRIAPPRWPGTNVASQSDLDKANAALDQANAQVVAGDAQISLAQSQITVLRGQRAEAEGQLKSLGLALDKANRDLGFTVLRAPYDGVVGNLAVQTGDLVSAGGRLASLVPTTALYVDANFKETQLSKLVPGEQVTIHVDAMDGDPIKGVVESLAPASGSVFSLLPPENATGQFYQGGATGAGADRAAGRRARERQAEGRSERGGRGGYAHGAGGGELRAGAKAPSPGLLGPAG